MAHKEIEVILMRRLASYLATPIFLVDPDGTLIFYNEPAEVILGHRFNETGEMRLEEWTTMFHPVDEHGAPLPPEELPLVRALTTQRAAGRSFSILGLDNKQRHIEVTAFPMIGQSNQLVGGVAIFWEAEGR